jgi:Ion channel
VRQLRVLGYTNVRHYHGGMADWKEAGGPVERSAAPTPTTSPPVRLLEPPRERPRSPLVSVSHRRQWGNAVLEWIERQSTSHLFLAWLVMIIFCGGVYWLASMSRYHGLVANGTSIDVNLRGLGTALYFSFVTATSIGYGDVVPVGAVRILAIAEAVTELLIFGAVVAKFVSRRQDALVHEIHRVTFEERLDRVQMYLHLVFTELQAIAVMCDDGKIRPERISARLESAVLVFTGELRAIHALLYRTQQAPEEAVLGAILASLATSLRELSELLTCLPPDFTRSPTLTGTLGTLARLADEICSECVPQVYAPALTLWMDRIQEIGRQIAP